MSVAVEEMVDGAPTPFVVSGVASNEKWKPGKSKPLAIRPMKVLAGCSQIVNESLGNTPNYYISSFQF